VTERNSEVLNTVASVVRCVVLLTATGMTRVRLYPVAASLELDLFLAFGAVYVLLTAFVDRLAARYRPATTALVALDVAYITGLVWYTGGLASEYYLLYYLPILHASMRLDFRQAIMSSLLAAACYALITVTAGLGSAVISSGTLQLATFGGSALVLALFFGSVAALSASQRELTRKLEHAVERLSALYRVARAVNAADSLQSVVDTTLELAVEMGRAQVGYLALSNEAGDLLVKSSRVGEDESDGRDYPGFDRYLAERCLVQRGAVVTDARGDHPEVPQRSSAGCCVVSVPLERGDRAYGALQLFNERAEACGEREIEVLVALAQEAAVAIENARLVTEVHRLSVTDRLTGLYHGSEFRRLLASEVDAARAKGDPITVLLLDIDGMRRINSEHGHQAGDEVLLAFADMLRRYIRSRDVAARYGRDEFAVLLPCGGVDAARAVSSRLCHALARHEFRFGENRDVHHVTLCAGAVVAREMPNDPEQLIGRADEALFEAKEAGPGQIRFWEATVRSGIVTHVREIVEHVQQSSPQWR